MNDRTHLLRWLARSPLPLVLVACADLPERSPEPPPAAPPPAFVGQRTFGFEHLAPGSPPAKWHVETTNPSGPEAVWVVRDGPGAHTGERYLELVDTRDAFGASYHLCWTDQLAFGDGTLEVAVHAGSGHEDQGGGPAWRIRGVDDYYVARWNPLEDNFRLYVVTGGRRLQLASADVHADATVWHTIRVRQEGARIACAFDGNELLHAEDATLTAPGGIGVWTKADAASAFDDLTVEAP